MHEPKIGNIRILPVREVNWPTPMPALIMPTTIGSIIRPAWVGEAPCTICMYCGSTVIAPNMAAPTITLAPMTTADRAHPEDAQRDQRVVAHPALGEQEADARRAAPMA